MTRTSEFRKFQQYKEKQHAKHIVKDIWQNQQLANNQKFIGKMSHSPQHCSCQICRNPRHHSYSSVKDKLTIQQKIADQQFKEQLAESEK